MAGTLKDFEITIKRGLTKPLRRNWEYKVREAIYAMNEGDCIDVPYNAYQQTTYAARKIGAKLSGFTLDDQQGYRLWLDQAPCK